jgi:transcription antitermination factor NusG
LYPEGVRRKPVYQYDIKKAYYWAGSLGLPRIVKNYKAGDKNFICIFENLEIPENAPNTFERKYVIATNEDIETYNLKGRILKAYKLEDFTFYPNEFIEDNYSDLPKKIFKRLTQAYWGIYANGSVLERVIMKDSGKLKNGKKIIKPEKIIMMPNRFQNYIYSSIIINRVIRRLYSFVKKTTPISVFVDSVLCEKPIQTGEKVGDMVLKDYFKGGILIKSSGLWTPLQDLPKDTFDYRHYYKHAGYKRG